MSSKSVEVSDKLKDLVDAIEECYGQIEGFEVRLEHPIVDGERQGYANIKEFVLIHLHRTEIEVKN